MSFYFEGGIRSFVKYLNRTREPTDQMVLRSLGGDGMGGGSLGGGSLGGGGMTPGMGMSGGISPIPVST